MHDRDKSAETAAHAVVCGAAAGEESAEGRSLKDSNNQPPRTEDNLDNNKEPLLIHTRASTFLR